MKAVKGIITPKGYLIIYNQGKYRKAHRVEWEKHYGEIPAGMHIHHRDGNKLNNHIDNLQLINPIEHSRLRNNYNLVCEGVWQKQCKKCKSWLPLDAFNSYKDGRGKPFIVRYCKKCKTR